MLLKASVTNQATALDDKQRRGSKLAFTKRSKRQAACRVITVGMVPYPAALEWQGRLVARRQSDEIGDSLLLMQHPSVYTIGRFGKQEDVLLSNSELSRRRIGILRADRGGGTTYHGPGQLVGYPIIKLGGPSDIGPYLRKLEEVVIRTVRSYGIPAGRIGGLTGVWVDECKIGSIGVRVTRLVTKHGFSLNLNTDLSFFDGIVACRLPDCRPTSLFDELNRPIDIDEAYRKVVHYFGEVFGYRMLEVDDGSSLLSEHQTAG